MSDNPFHDGGFDTNTAEKQFSIHVSKTLDILGKSPEIVKYRVIIYRKIQEFLDVIEKLPHLENIIAGSKAEGLTSIYESDMDCITVLLDVICVDNVKPFIHHRNATIVQTNRHDTKAGYTKLKLVKYLGRMSSIIINELLFEDESGEKYISSDAFVKRIFQDALVQGTRDIIRYERSGPSLPTSETTGHLHVDRVHAFRCVCPTILKTFLTRPRPYNRPSRKELCDIALMDAHVVPVGYKGSNASHLEWRICFTKAEIILVKRFNNIETKLYILLKMISKLLKCLSKDITSYVMKNVVLWLVELQPVYLFIEELLTYQLIKALRFLQKCVETRFLPSYMIPDRNLLADTLNPVQRIQLTDVLSSLVQERGYLLLRCEKLREGMTIFYREPTIAEEYRKRRDMTEKSLLLWDIVRIYKMATTGMSREEVERLMKTDMIKLFATLVKVLCPEPMILMLQIYNDKALTNLCNERLIQMMS